MKKKIFSIALFLTVTALTCCIFGIIACNSKGSYSIYYSEIEENGEVIAYSVNGSSAGKNIEIPSSYNDKPVTAIGDSAFNEGAFLVVQLESITIPDSVTSIGRNAFSGCTKLTDVNFSGTIRQWEDIDKGESWDSAMGIFNGKGLYIINCTDGEIKVAAGEKEEAVINL